AALDALEEEAVRAPVDLEEGRHRRLEVGEYLAEDRDDVARARQRRDVAAGGRDRPGAERALALLHSDATKACVTPSRSRRRCITSVACSALAKRPTCTRYQVSRSRRTRTSVAS